MFLSLPLGKEKDGNSPVIFCIFVGFFQKKTELYKKNGVFETLPQGEGSFFSGRKKKKKSRKTILTFLWLYDLNSGHRQETEIAAADTPRIPPYQERSPIPVPIFVEKII